MSAENAALRRQITETQEASKKEQKEEVQRTMRTLFNTKRTPSYRYTPGGKWQTDAEVELFHVFRILGPEMLIEASVSGMAGTLAMHIRADKANGWDIVALNQMKGLLADLTTLDLVQPSPKKHPVSDTEAYWSLSAFGREALKAIFKVTLSETPETPSPHDDDGSTSPGGESGGARPESAPVDDAPVN
ncbi:hypothetical protein [Leifsonia sp. EB34]|uniref:hypothetical protein n=1 Tax=Leifsonia sp. EB34 TaxID=3156303 RepID=UPI00351769A6